MPSTDENHFYYFDDDNPPSPAHADAAKAFAEAVAAEHESQAYVAQLWKEFKDMEGHSPVNIDEWPFVNNAAQQLLVASQSRRAAEAVYAREREIALASAKACRVTAER